MKLSLHNILILFAVVFSACDSNEQDEVIPVEFAGTWQLTKSYSGWSGDVFSADQLPYKEYYSLSADSTFKKFRSTGAEATGIYTLQKIDGRYYAVLNYKEIKESEGSPILMSCYSNQSYLVLESPGTMSDNNLPCDGPNNIYKRIKETD